MKRNLFKTKSKARGDTVAIKSAIYPNFIIAQLITEQWRHSIYGKKRNLNLV